MVNKIRKMDKLSKRLLREQQRLDLHRQLAVSEKAQKRAEKEQARLLETTTNAAGPELSGPVNIACLIHSDGYDWEYVERLYSMVRRNLSRPVVFHVYTEPDRHVPSHMIKHELIEWPGQWGMRKSWWYKLQIFNNEHFSGPMLYLDLDVVIVRSIDWLVKLPPNYLWAPKDYRVLWKATHRGINSSVMWWDVNHFAWVYEKFAKSDLNYLMKQYQGDQDYLSAVIPENSLRHTLPMTIMSWRWQVLDGGLNFKTRQPIKPGTGTNLDARTSILVFHGSPKPHEVSDPVIETFWQ
jgi:hypothetical protein